MVQILKELGISGHVFIIIVAVVFVAEIIKVLTQIGSFLLARYAGVRTRYTKKKEDEERALRNEDELRTFKSDQEEFNKSMKSSLSEVVDTVKDISDVVVSIQVEAQRKTILDFASSSSNGRPYTREQFNYVMKVYQQYEDVIHKRNITNDEVELSYEIIKNIYAERMKEHSFIEDKISDPMFQEKLKEVEHLKSSKHGRRSSKSETHHEESKKVDKESGGLEDNIKK